MSQHADALDKALNHCITTTNVPFLDEPYRGKVRDVYRLPDDKLAIIATDRISSFDYILRQAIPYKGQILSSIATYFFNHVEDIIPTHLLEMPHPNVTIAKSCKVIPIEVVVRGYLTGHAWRTYRSGLRELCGVSLPDGLKEHQKFDTPLLTPATKAEEGHDEDISEMEILDREIVSAKLWTQIRETAFKLFERGTQMAKEKGLILVDTKYEFGLYRGKLVLIDEVHTPDSSRYFYLEGYQEKFEKGESQRQLSKEFIREWLMEHDFQGKDGQTMPDLPDEFRIEVYERYAELHEKLTGTAFEPVSTEGFDATLQDVLENYI